MNLSSQRRIAASVLGVGLNKVWFDPERLQEIKEAITKSDIRGLIKDLAIQAKPEKGNSSYRDRKRKLQKRKGRQKGKGSRKGTPNARTSKKKIWAAKVRKQRQALKIFKDKNLITPAVYKTLYLKIKGGFFRSKRHLQLYIKSRNLLKEKK